MMGPLAWVLNVHLVVFLGYKELISIQKNLKRDVYGDKPSYWLEYLIYCALLFARMPTYSFRQAVLIESGITQDAYPLVHLVLFTHQKVILSILGGLIFVLFVLSLKREKYAY